MAEGFITRKGGGVNVNDATATENDVLQGETFYSGDKDIKTGNIPSKGAETFTPSTSNQTISSGQYLSGTQTILGDSDLIPENIRENTTIFGVTGTLTPPPPSYYLSFDGVDDYVNMGNVNDFNFTSNFAVSVEFNTEMTGNGSLIGKYGTSSSNPGFRLRLDNGVLWVAYGDGNTRPTISLGSGYNDGNWHTAYVEFNMSNDTVDIYVDNQFLGNLDISGMTDNISNNELFGIGVNPSSGLNSQFFDGDIRDVKIYSDLGNTLLSHYDFSDSSGNTLTDIVGNNDGTIVGATWVEE